MIAEIERAVLSSDRELEIDFDGLTVSVTMLTRSAPLTVRALLSAVPIMGSARHAKWNGPAFYLPIARGVMPDLPRENVHHVVRPGSVVYVADPREILITYGDVRLSNGPGDYRRECLIGRIKGDLRPLQDEVLKMRMLGKRPLTIRGVW